MDKNYTLNPIEIAFVGTGNPIVTDEDKEIAAKAIECGYIDRKDDTLFPKILVFRAEDQANFVALSSDFNTANTDLADTIAEKLGGLMKSIIPPHLINEYPMFSMAASMGILNDTIEKCIESNILNVPKTSFAQKALG